MINWEHHRAGLGQAVEITSGADRHAFFSPHQTRLFRAHACVYVGHADFGVLELGPCAGTLCCRPAVYGRSPNAFKHARSGLHGALVPWHAFQRWCQVCRASKTWVPTERDQKTLTVALPVCRHALRGGIPDPCRHPGRGWCCAARLHQLRRRPAQPPCRRHEGVCTAQMKKADCVRETAPPARIGCDGLRYPRACAHHQRRRRPAMQSEVALK